MVNRILAVVTACVVLMVTAPVAHADVLSATKSSVDSATFTTTAPGPSAPPGVSPDVFFDSVTGTYYLITTSMPPVEYTSTDGVNWTATKAVLPNGFDWSIVQEGPASYRLYYAEIPPSAGASGPPKPCVPGSKILRYATSTDLRTWSPQPGILLDDVGCGVPHVMKTSSGKYFLYMNKGLPVHGVYVATSMDGLNWSQPVGIIANNTDLVDPAPLELPDGTFVMVGSTTGAKSASRKQELQLLSSADALTWYQRPTSLFSANGASALDPSIELVNGQLKVWFGYAPGYDHNNSHIANGTLTLGSGAVAGALVKAGAKCVKKGSISGKFVCKSAKGKLVWSRR